MRPKTDTTSAKVLNTVDYKSAQEHIKFLNWKKENGYITESMYCTDDSEILDILEVI
jgi:hypothetical protein